MNIDVNGIVSTPLQPAIVMEIASTIPNLAVGGSSNTTIVFGSAIYDKNSDFNTSTGIFTAPVAGIYLVNLRFELANLDTDTTSYTFNILSTQRNYSSRFDPDYGDSDTLLYTVFISAQCNCSAGDTIRPQFYVDGGAAQADILAGGQFSVVKVT